MRRIGRSVLVAVTVVGLLACSKEGGENKDEGRDEASEADEGENAQPEADETAEKDGEVDPEPAAAAGKPGEWARVGKRGTWQGTRLAAVIGGHMFTIERGDGRIFKTDLSDGSYETIGGADFGDSRFLLAGEDALYTIETDGRLFRIDPNDGSWKTVHDKAQWGATRLAVIRGGYMYSIERGDGRIFKTDLSDGSYTTIGGADFGDTRYLLAGEDALYTIEADGRLFRVGAEDGSWKTVHDKSQWGATRFAVIRGGYMYSIERGDGRIFKTDVSDGSYETIGGADFADTRRLLAAPDAVYTIEADGSLYRVVP